MSKLKCCPLCGGTITVDYLYQYAHRYEIGKRGKITRRFRKVDIGVEGISLAFCSNENCKAYWETDMFFIDENDCFVDFKYTETGGDDK